MTLSIQITVEGLMLSATNQRRIRAHLARLGRRLTDRPQPAAVLSIKRHVGQRRTAADLRLELGPHGPTLVGRQESETPDVATRLAIESVERQLERRTADQRGDAAFGVPSRREPRGLRPHPREEG